LASNRGELGRMMADFSVSEHFVSTTIAPL
jgi:hypothetical protein